MGFAGKTKRLITLFILHIIAFETIKTKSIFRTAALGLLFEYKNAKIFNGIQLALLVIKIKQGGIIYAHRKT